MKRRHFISLAGLSAVSACVPGARKTEDKEKEEASKTVSSPISGHFFPALPYAYNALEPYIDAQTMELHHDKHHRGYFKTFTAAIDHTSLETTSLPEIFGKVSTLSPVIRNAGGGYYNHILYWENMSPQESQPSARILSAIVKHFGSYDELINRFNNAAKTLFGSGWAWLILDENKDLKITATANQDNPLMDVVNERGIPMLTIDIWEHAYYLKYQNRRTDYIDSFWKIINWETVNKRFDKAVKGEWIG